MNIRSSGHLVLGLLLALVPLGAAWSEVVEEETWFGASGEVVKTVKRTDGEGFPPRAQASWEPSWVIRDREQDQRRAASRSRVRWSGRNSWSSYYRPISYRVPYRSSRSWNYSRRSYGLYRTSGWRVAAGRGRLIIGYSN